MCVWENFLPPSTYKLYLWSDKSVPGVCEEQLCNEWGFFFLSALCVLCLFLVKKIASRLFDWLSKRFLGPNSSKAALLLL